MKTKMLIVMAVLALTLVGSIGSAADESGPLKKAADLILQEKEETSMTPQMMEFFKIPGGPEIFGKPKWIAKGIQIRDKEGQYKWFVYARTRPDSTRIDLIVIECCSGVGEKYGQPVCNDCLNIWHTSADGVIDGTLRIQITEKANLIGPVNKEEAEAKFRQIVDDLSEWAKKRSKKQVPREGKAKG